MNSQAKLINGTKIAQAIRQELKAKVARLADKPGLAIILVGNDAGSHTYVNLKEKAAEEAGIHFEKDYYPATVSQDIILKKIAELNSRKDIHGILVQFPLPKGFDENKIVAAIDPVKDVDGFHPDNVRLLLDKKPRLIPGLALGIMRLIVSTGINLSGRQAAILAKSEVFANPLKQLLEQKGVRAVFVTPSSTDFIERLTQADVVVVAIGQPRFLKDNMIKEGVVVVDVGYNRVNDKAVGDVDFESVSQKAGWITPVPGGVGPMTVAMLLSNVLLAYDLQKES